MWNEIISFFERQSALANFLQIATIPLGLWAFAKWAKARYAAARITTLSAWLAAKGSRPLTPKSLRVAVVDDRPEDYPLDTLRRLGYSIASIAHLTLADIPSLLRYDCILLDINGVLDEDPKEGGLKILQRLKVAGGPYVVAVSSRGFDITMSEFFMQADHRLKKPIPRADVEGIIEQAFIARFSAEHAARRIDESAAFNSSLSGTQKRALRAMRDYLNSSEGVDNLRRQISFVVPGDRIEDTIADLNVIRRALSRKE